MPFRHRRNTPLGAIAKVVNFYALARALRSIFGGRGRRRVALAAPGAPGLAGVLALVAAVAWRRRTRIEEYAGAPVQEAEDVIPRETGSNVAGFRTVDAGDAS